MFSLSGAGMGFADLLKGFNGRSESISDLIKKENLANFKNWRFDMMDDGMVMTKKSFTKTRLTFEDLKNDSKNCSEAKEKLAAVIVALSTVLSNDEAKDNANPAIVTSDIRKERNFISYKSSHRTRQTIKTNRK